MYSCLFYAAGFAAVGYAFCIAVAISVAINAGTIYGPRVREVERGERKLLPLIVKGLVMKSDRRRQTLSDVSGTIELGALARP
jgi:hypothetical protein